MKYLFAISLLFLSFCIYPQNNNLFNQLPSSQIITDEMIKSAGLVNLADIITLIDKVDHTTIDGFTNYSSYNKLSTYGSSGLIVMLNGQVVNVEIFGNLDLNLLPISIDQIKQVDVTVIPHIENGNFSANGTLNFITKPYPEGFSINAAYTVANETGDPGPYRYTEYQSPNVDKLNFISAFTLAAKGEKWDLSSNIKLEENFITDQSIKTRIQNLSGAENKARLNSVSLHFAFEFMGRKQKIIGGLSNKNDFFFFKPYGNEIPVRRIINYAGMNGGFFISEKMDFNYSFSYSRNNLDKNENRKELDFDFGLEKMFANFESIYKTGNKEITFGISLDDITAHKPADLTDNSILKTNLYSIYSWRFSESFQQKLSGMITKIDGNYSYKTDVNNIYKLDKYNILQGAFSLGKSLFDESTDFWVWLERGYSTNISDLLEFNNSLIPKNSSFFTADLIYKWKPNQKYSFEMGVLFRSGSEQLQTNQIFQFNETSKTWNAPITFYNSNYNSLGANLILEYNPSKKWKNKFTYGFTKFLSGTEIQEKIWEEFPVHVLGYSIQFAPARSFGIWGRVRYFSSYDWINYKYAEIQSKGEYLQRIDSKILFDVALSKWFWANQIWTNLSLRNFSNNVERYHTIGAALDLRIIFQAHLYLDSLIK